jgi:lipid-binding SYLF domain-containing protein
MRAVVRPITALLFLALAHPALAQDKTADIKDEVEQSTKAADAFSEIMSAPDKAIPKDILDDAECVAVFPTVVKAAFVVGGQGGRGVASCRTPNGWSAPAFFNLGGGSFGFQIGAEATDLVMLFMNEEGMQSLLGSKFELGGDASVAAGPVGRQTSATTDAKMNAKILSYSRSKGAFAGVSLKGAVIEPADDDMHDVYGSNATAKAVLTGAKLTVPAPVQAFPNTLSRYSTRKAATP